MTTRRPTLVLLAALGLIAAACSSAGPRTTAGTSASGTQPPDRDGLTRVGLRLEWTAFAPVTSGGSLANLDVLGDLLIAEDSRGICSALSPVSGEVRWSTPLGGPTTRFVGNIRDGETILACSETEVYFLDTLTGALVNRQRFARVATTRPAHLGDRLVLGGAGNVVFAHSMASGFAAWTYTLLGPIDVAPAVLNPSAVAVASRTGDVLIIDPASGGALTRMAMFDGPGGNIAASEDTVFIASRDQSVYAFRAGDSQVAWRARTDSALAGASTFASGRVFAVVPSLGLTAFDARTGLILWSASTVAGDVIATRAGNLLAWDGKEAVLLDAVRGDVIGRALLPGIDQLTPDRQEMTALYATTRAGVIHKLLPR
ncbi:MAG: PQQ-binding-like beta-propeller repeat protein [Phycisphaerales bacterium]